ncbi:unnamed protein product [Brachionus calyciflorus]|uniref:TIR domain-containing protein n=1 Tax=Brachionus calyciflorus TaxID=104777 RepID=A0A814L362_9BILA|nr:unnamed protein product [Brachionus calyciflorus]
MNEKNQSEFNFLKGLILFRKKEYKKAIATFENQINLNSNHFNSYACLFLTKKREGIFTRLQKKPAELFKNIRLYDKAIFSSIDFHQLWTRELNDQLKNLLEMKRKETNILGNTFKKFQIFFSYNWAYQDRIKSLKEMIEKLGFCGWLDIVDLRLGDELLDQLKESIDNSTVVFIFLSNEYLNSPNCRTELIYTCESKKTLLPLYLERPNKLDWSKDTLNIKDQIIDKKLYVQLYKLDIQDILDHKKLCKKVAFYNIIKYLTDEFEKYFE